MGQASSIEEAVEVKAPSMEERPSLSLPAKTLIAGVAFGASLPIAQRVGKLCRISCATPLASWAFGAAFVALCSTSSMQIVNQIERIAAAEFPDVDAGFSSSSQILPVLLPALMGLVSFKALGGKYRNLLPSDVRFPGVYALAYLPSGMRYASKHEKFLIRLLYREFGCHHCGKTIGESIADHIPPNALHWKPRRRLKLTQKFYPQCIPCMKVQSSSLRHGLNPLVYHHKSGWPQPFVFSGFFLPALVPDAEELKGELLAYHFAKWA
ncbi:uncharacterized protein LOC9652271 isoform X1 [Selaginella moellendorffii]|uniref:uncharacterized protein LOC9652271 isoform X1 n=1 Tax=Selaginella moellendorffii TaxID=88036 RepID=UPI000D1C7891|nr:uncharacterized protein LOC9652271 isoform X1 [Selaginella moellendorffii]|eukprot:XP_024526816.1 uncharacterized protein LOC9652271 isoform X1 [Selaginella moellendorffii]